MPPHEVTAWLARARPGERLIYGRGPQMIQGLTQQLLRARAVDSEVFLFQPRSKDCGGFDFLVVKRITAQRLPASPRIQQASDQAMVAIYRRLKRAADLGERCPTDAMLAALAGLNVPQTKWRMRKLVQAGKIATRVVPALADPRFRIVTIASTGRQTAAPVPQ